MMISRLIDNCNDEQLQIYLLKREEQVKMFVAFLRNNESENISKSKYLLLES